MKIALTFSGGGFRAAAFGLGALSLMNKIELEDQSLLDHVFVLSTVSGGTITGARYAIGRKREESFETIYGSLYHFLSNANLVKLALERLTKDDGWDDSRVRNLITAFADIYDEELFNEAKFGELMSDLTTGIQHLSFNATEFANALQFRFQWSEKIREPKLSEPERGIIGNNYFAIPIEVAREIRMADIMAASSCFPGGFEPVNFPNDFVLGESSKNAAITGTNYPVGLMDGGIVDNQGIAPVLLAEARMKRNRVDSGNTSNVLDLIMVCDVASPYMKSFEASHQNKKGWWKSSSPIEVISINLIVFLLSLIGVCLGCYFNNQVLIIFSTILLTATTVIAILFKFLKSVAKGLGVPQEFFEPLGQLLRLKFYVYQNLVLNRLNSMVMLTMNVFLKHVRRLNYNALYGDKLWNNRRIMNAIYELRTGEGQLQKKVEKGLLPEVLLPSEAIQKNSDLAASMGTTLWFTKEELEETKMLDVIIACGQYTTCWNLLEYIYLIKKDPENINEEHKKLLSCEITLLKLWAAFQANPLFMLMSEI